jgi:hypothetical protein
MCDMMWLAAASIKPSELCFFTKCTTFFHHVLSWMRTSLARVGLKVGSLVKAGRMKGAGGSGGEGSASDMVDGMEYIDRFGDGRPVRLGLKADSVDDSPGIFGGSFFLNKLDIPDTMTPGCIPSNGASKFTAPRIRCLK